MCDAAAFEASFKALKEKRKEAEKKLPSFEKVDCLTLTLTLTLIPTPPPTLTPSLTLTLPLTLR